MDNFSHARETALQLYKELTAGKKLNELDPFAVVSAAAQHLGLELAFPVKDDPILKGARATFDDQAGLICCEDVGTAAEKALLIAHEIGHACLHHTSSSCNEGDIDVTSSSEHVSLGLQRVEDYGVHERRELQANVYARELVLPRPLVRELYLSKAMTAEDIAQKTGLPHALVFQQLLDAILLPPDCAPEEQERPANYVPRHDLSQDRAVQHRDTAFQLQAGPGTGKTRTLVKRIISLVQEGAVPDSILVLTFSNKAAGELVERISKELPDVASQIWVGTFHAFGLDLLRRHHDKLGLSSSPVLFDRSDAIEILEERLPILPLVHYRNLWDPTLALRDILSAISRAKDELVDASQYQLLAEEMLKKAVDEEAREEAEKCLEVAHVYKIYEQILSENDAIDFGDLIMKLAVLLEKDAKLRAVVQLRHRHVLVDEYQDVNRASARLLKAVADDGKRLWVVGDSRQSIYRFRGASSANMALFSQEYPGAKIDQLEVNYRSSQQIIEAFSAFSTSMGASDGMLPLKLTADRGNGPAIPEVRQHTTKGDECGGVAASIKELERQGIALRDQVVLCRSNGRLNEIAGALEARDIPVLHLGSLFERDEVRDLLAILSLAVDRHGSGLVRIASMSRYNIPLQDIYLLTQKLKKLDKTIYECGADHSFTEGLSAKGLQGYQLLLQDLAGSEKLSSAWERLAVYFIDKSQLMRNFADDSIRVRMCALAVWQFFNFIRDQSLVGKGAPIQRTLDRVRQLVLLGEERDLRQVPLGALHMNAVRLMTIHGSKGLEFEAVHVPTLAIQSFPTNHRKRTCLPPEGMITTAKAMSVEEEEKQAHQHEEECLFFVALSRAKKYLRLYHPTQQEGGRKRSPSVFLEKIPSRLLRVVTSPDVLPPTQPEPAPLPITITKPDAWITDSNKFSLYEKCPRRFFYTHILGLGGAKKSTPFTRTHDCIHDLRRWLADKRKTDVPSLQEAEAAFEKIWGERGPTGHAFEKDYRQLASKLLLAMVRSGVDCNFLSVDPLIVNLSSGRIAVEPDEVIEMPDGTVILRRVRTGKKTSKEYEKMEYTLYFKAAHQKFGGAFRLEAHHLTDDIIEQVEVISEKRRENQHQKMDSMLADINAGIFPPKEDDVACPRCPHFFICAATPSGDLNIS